LKRKKKALMRKIYKNPPLIEALCEFYFAPEISQDFDSIVNLLYHIEDALEACITDQLRNKFEEVKEC